MNILVQSAASCSIVSSESIRILERLTNAEFVAMTKEQFTEQFLAEIKRQDPKKRITKNLRQRIEIQPDYAWSIRAILEDKKWDDPRELLQAYADLSAVCSYDAQSHLNTGLAFSLEDMLKKMENPDPDLRFIRHNISNRTLKSHQVIENMGIDLPEEDMERLFQRLDTKGCKVIIDETDVHLYKYSCGAYQHIKDLKELAPLYNEADQEELQILLDKIQAIAEQEQEPESMLAPR